MTNRSRPGFLEGGGLKETGTKMELSDSLSRGAAAMVSVRKMDTDLSDDKSDVKTSKGVQYLNNLPVWDH